MEIVISDPWYSSDAAETRSGWIMKIAYHLVYHLTIGCLIDRALNNIRIRFFLGFSLKKQWVKTKHQMKTLNPIYIWHQTWHCLRKCQCWIFILHCLMKRGGVESVFPFVKGENSERVQDMNQKLIKPRV